jgi:Trk K+ transport system NAD-binding subunit
VTAEGATEPLDQLTQAQGDARIGARITRGRSELSGSWSGHVIVCGLRGVGVRIVEQLHAAGTPVVIVDDDPDPALSDLGESLGVPHLRPAGRIEEALWEAGLAGAAAVACVERDDLRALGTALLVRELSPATKVVVNLDNPAVGRGVASVTGAGSVLDVAALFAPSVIETCTRENAHRLDVEQVAFAVAEATPAQAGTLRELFGDLAPMGVAPGDGRELLVCPGRDLEVEAGDRVWLLGSLEQLQDARLAGADHPYATRSAARFGALRRIRDRLGVLTDERDRGLRVLLGIVLALVVVSSAVLRFGYRPSDGHAHLSALDAVYFTVETISTVGFGDFSFSGQPHWLEAFGVLLIVLGAAVLTTLFSFITNALVRRRIDQSLGRARVAGVSGHVLLVGLGAVGMRVLEGLIAHGRQVVVVERDESNPLLNQARALGVRVVVGDATLQTTLDLANLASASAVAILTSDDLANIETGLAVRDGLAERWVEVPVVLRVFDRPLGQRVQRSFHFHHVWSTSAIAAPWFIGVALGLDVLATFFVDHEPFLLARLTVAPSGGLAGVAMRELSARMRVVAIRRAGEHQALEHPPRRDTRFAPGDQAYLAGPSEELLKVLRREQSSGLAAALG